MEELKKQNATEEKNPDLINQFGSLIVNSFELLKVTLKFNDEHINHEEVRVNILKDITFKGYNVWILMCSVVICSIGLNINSAAVVIGAMLISPLMGPILGLGLSIGTNDLENLKASIQNFLVALGVSILTSTIFFLISPLQGDHAELLARTQPTFLDALVAVFGGLAGVIAISRKDSSNVIPGVAIATALMPPICTAGYGLANGNMSFFLGALYLFLLNSVFISLSTLVIVRYLHFPFISFVDKAREKRVKRYIALISLVIIIPSAFLFFEVTQESIFHRRAEAFTTQNINYKGAEIINQKFIYHKEGSIIEVFVIGNQIPEDVIWTWEQELLKSELNNSTLKIVQNKDNSHELVGTIGERVKSGIIKELYQKKFEELQTKNNEIDRLLTELNTLKGSQIDWKQLQKEILIQYPNLESLSFGTTIRMDSALLDTIPSLIPTWKQGNQSEQLKEWLKVRLGEDEIQVIEPLKF